MTVFAIYPTLDACVETQTKRLYNQTTSSLLENPDDPELQDQFETLRLFLEQADFHKLRAESEPLLLEGNKVTFEVWREDDKIRWEMKTRVV
jgi:hypothetical protein